MLLKQPWMSPSKTQDAFAFRDGMPKQCAAASAAERSGLTL
jgi:hypothetical protein